MEWLPLVGAIVALIGLVVGWFFVPAPVKLALSILVKLAPLMAKPMPADKLKAWRQYERENPSARRIDFERKWKREHERG